MKDVNMPGFEEEESQSKKSQKFKKKILENAFNALGVDPEFMESLDVETEFADLDEVEKDEELNKIVKYPYVSKEGYVISKIKRGFQEISYLYNLIKDNDINCFICGGYVRYMCSPNQDPYKAGDVDVYSYSEEDYKKLYKLLKSNVIDGKTYTLKKRHENEVSITFSRCEDSDHPLFVAPAIQLIKPMTQGSMILQGDMKTVLDNFDFTVVRCGLINRNEAMVDADFDYDEKEGMLRLKNIHCPISSTIRCVKYGKKGYWITPTQTLKLFMDWDSRDDEYRFKIIEMVQKFEKEGITQAELNELEALMKVD